jgi:Flp pilus assembly protein TadG
MWAIQRSLRDRLRRRKSFREDRAQAAFEFLLILPYFVLFVVLLIDFGILMYEYVSVSNASREGARYASDNCGDGSCVASEVQTRVAQRSGGIVSSADAGTEVTVSWPSGVSRGSPVSVKVDHPYDFLFFPATIHVVSCSTMRLEQQDTSATTGGSLC